MQKIERSPQRNAVTRSVQRNADDQPIPPNKRAAMRAAGATSGYACKMFVGRNAAAERIGRSSARATNGRKNSALQKIRNAAALFERTQCKV